jgi:ABC-2 type transport system ATP-binding protein
VNAVEVRRIIKTFGEKKAVDDLTFTVDAGEIVGLIGPNGAGKTTTIRMMMDILKPDAGEVRIFGEECSPAIKRRMGYLPEERGLYRKLRVMDCILYLASLVGVDKRAAQRRAEALLERTGMMASAGSRIETLSKGMSQLIQFVVSIIHDPDVVVLDEPFTGLDPVNTDLLKTIVRDLKGQGKAVMLSTHAMNDVEELCDRVLMVHKGTAILYGSLAEIRSRFPSDSVLVDVEGDPGWLPGVVKTRERRGHVEYLLQEGASAQDLLGHLVRAGKVIRHFEPAAPSLNEIFLKLVEEGDEQDAPDLHA